MTAENGDERWTFGELTQSDSQVAQGATADAADGYSCRHAIRAVSNVVIEAAACHDHVAGEANRIAENIAANVPA